MEAGAGRDARDAIGGAALSSSVVARHRQPASQRPSSPLAPCRDGAPSTMQVRIEKTKGSCLAARGAEEDAMPARAPSSCRCGAAACRPRARASTTGPGGRTGIRFTI